MPKKRSSKAANGHRKAASSKSTPAPSPTPTPPATDIPPAPRDDAVPPHPHPHPDHEPNSKVEVIQPSPPSPPDAPDAPDVPPTTTGPDTPADAHPGDSTVLVERPGDAPAPLTAEPKQLSAEAQEQLHQQAVEEQIEEQEIADELVDLVESIAESDADADADADAVDAAVPTSEDGVASSLDAVAAAIERVQERVHKAAAVESILLNNGGSSTPSTPPRSNGHADEDEKSAEQSEQSELSGTDSPHPQPQLRRAASTSFVASALSTSPNSHGRTVHKHLRFTAADEAQTEEAQHHVYYPRKRNLNGSDPGTPSIAET